MRPDPRQLEQRIRELEEKVFRLRLSRRVLMFLLEESDREKETFIRSLRKENQRLRLANSRYALTLLHKNRQIVNLQSRLDNPDGFPRD